jgi:hypothetical protein
LLNGLTTRRDMSNMPNLLLGVDPASFPPLSMKLNPAFFE